MAFTIFPLFGINPAQGEEKATCQCSDPECSRVGKHPSYLWGQLVAGQQVRGPAGHGIVTGQKSGIFVVDTDGWEADEKFRETYDVPDTFTVATPSGGRHYYFKWPSFFVKNSVGQLLPNVDIRGEGGFVVAPGSPHKSGLVYEVEYPDAIANAPEWLIQWPGLKGRAPSEGSANAPFPVDVTTEVGQKRVELGRTACLEMPASVQGEDGSNALLRVALRLVRDYELPIDTCHELVATVFNPRCEPTWNDKEILHKLLDARDKSDRPCGNVTPIDTDTFQSSWDAKPCPVPSTRKQKSPGHTYPVEVGMIPSGQGAKTSFSNMCAVLRGHADWAGVLQLDTFRDRVYAVDPPTRLDAEGVGYSDKDTDRVVNWFGLGGGLEERDEKTGEMRRVPGFAVAPDVAFRAVMLVASENAYHPVREYLNGIPIVDGAYLEHAATSVFGRESALETAYLRRFLIAAVRRVLHPGTKVDNMLVLAGPQGVGKSTFVRELFGPEWTAEDLPALDKKDAVEVLRGKWAIEVAELDKILRTEAETAKAFLSRCVDTFRPSYGRSPIDRARECVFVGTTNRDDILRDATGSRRYWIVKSDTVDLAWVRSHRDQLWAAALDLVRKGEPHWLTLEEDAMRESAAKDWEERDPWHEKIVEFLAGKKSVSVDEVWKHIGGMTEGLGRREQVRITDTLRRLGCVNTVETVGRQKVRKWSVPFEVAGMRAVAKQATI